MSQSPQWGSFLPTPSGCVLSPLPSSSLFQACTQQWDSQAGFLPVLPACLWVLVPAHCTFRTLPGRTRTWLSGESCISHLGPSRLAMESHKMSFLATLTSRATFARREHTSGHDGRGAHGHQVCQAGHLQAAAAHSQGNRGPLGACSGFLAPSKPQGSVPSSALEISLGFTYHPEDLGKDGGWSVKDFGGLCPPTMFPSPFSS